MDEGFITDSFNLYGIGRDSHLYRPALDIILCNNKSDNLDCNLLEEYLSISRNRQRGIGDKCRVYLWNGSLSIYYYK